MLISRHPFIGHSTDKENVRVNVLKEYMIFYEITVKEIVVLLVWDCRQNPEDLKILFFPHRFSLSLRQIIRDMIAI